MMHGSVNQNCEAVLPVVIKNNTKTQLVDAVIDTGFSGFLTLPSSTIDINESETVPLIGMRLLRGYDLHIQAIESGSVRIEALSIVA